MVKLRLCYDFSQSTRVKLVKPATGASGVAKYLAKRGPGMHHICLEVDNLEEMLADMKAKGVKLINETPTIGAGGKKIAFIHPSSATGVLVERIVGSIHSFAVSLIR